MVLPSLSAVDNVDGANLVWGLSTVPLNGGVSYQNGSVLPIGTVIFTVSASDRATPANKGTCIFNIRVADVQAPTMACPTPASAGVVVGTPWPGSRYAPVGIMGYASFPVPTVSDNSGLQATTACSLAPGDFLRTV